MGGSPSLTGIISSINEARNTITALPDIRDGSKDDLKATRETLAQLREAVRQYAPKENRISGLTSTPTRILAAISSSTKFVADINVLLADYKCGRISWDSGGGAKMVKLWERLGACKSEWDAFLQLLDGVNRGTKRIESRHGSRAIDQSAGKKGKKNKAIEPPKGKRAAKAKVHVW